MQKDREIPQSITDRLESLHQQLSEADTSPNASVTLQHVEAYLATNKQLQNLTKDNTNFEESEFYKKGESLLKDLDNLINNENLSQEGTVRIRTALTTFNREANCLSHINTLEKALDGLAKIESSDQIRIADLRHVIQQNKEILVDKPLSTNEWQTSYLKQMEHGLRVTSQIIEADLAQSNITIPKFTSASQKNESMDTSPLLALQSSTPQLMQALLKTLRLEPPAASLTPLSNRQLFIQAAQDVASSFKTFVATLGGTPKAQTANYPSQLKVPLVSALDNARKDARELYNSSTITTFKDPNTKVIRPILSAKNKMASYFVADQKDVLKLSDMTIKLGRALHNSRELQPSLLQQETQGKSDTISSTTQNLHKLYQLALKSNGAKDFLGQAADFSSNKLLVEDPTKIVETVIQRSETELSICRLQQKLVDIYGEDIQEKSSDPKSILYHTLEDYRSSLATPSSGVRYAFSVALAENLVEITRAKNSMVQHPRRENLSEYLSSIERTLLSIEEIEYRGTEGFSGLIDPLIHSFENFNAAKTEIAQTVGLSLAEMDALHHGTSDVDRIRDKRSENELEELDQALNAYSKVAHTQEQWFPSSISLPSYTEYELDFMLKETKQSLEFAENYSQAGRLLASLTEPETKQQSTQQASASPKLKQTPIASSPATEHLHHAAKVETHKDTTPTEETTPAKKAPHEVKRKSTYAQQHQRLAKARKATPHRSKREKGKELTEEAAQLKKELHEENISDAQEELAKIGKTLASDLEQTPIASSSATEDLHQAAKDVASSVKELLETDEKAPKDPKVEKEENQEEDGPEPPQMNS